MWQFERKVIAGKAVGWCIEHSVEPDAVGIIVALDELKLLCDPNSKCFIKEKERRLNLSKISNSSRYPKPIEDDWSTDVEDEAWKGLEK